MKVRETKLKALLTSGLQGDSASYSEFLSRLTVLLRDYVRHQLFRMRQSDADIEDIVQEALIAIHRKRHTYDGETPVTAWAYAITRYKLIDSLRARSYLSEWQLTDDIGLPVPDNHPIEAKIALDNAFRRLPDTLRIPLELTKLHGFTSGEAAEKIGTSESTVRVNVHRGLKALMRLLGAKHEVHDEDK